MLVYQWVTSNIFPPSGFAPASEWCLFLRNSFPSEKYWGCCLTFGMSRRTVANFAVKEVFCWTYRTWPRIWHLFFVGQPNARWWFQIFFIFTPIWGFPFWLIFFRWVETTNQQCDAQDNHVEELPHAVAHVMEAMKEAIAKTSKVGGLWGSKAWGHIPYR